MKLVAVKFLTVLSVSLAVFWKLLPLVSSSLVAILADVKILLGSFPTEPQKLQVERECLFVRRSSTSIFFKKRLESAISSRKNGY